MAKRHSPRQRARILESYHSGGRTQRDFCEAHGISVPTRSNWLRQARAVDGTPQSGPCPVPVVELSIGAPADDGPVSIELPSGIVIRCEARQTAAVLSQVALTSSAR
jgi:transposase-like protein